MPYVPSGSMGGGRVCDELTFLLCPLGKNVYTLTSKTWGEREQPPPRQCKSKAKPFADVFTGAYRLSKLTSHNVSTCENCHIVWTCIHYTSYLTGRSDSTPADVIIVNLRISFLEHFADLDDLSSRQQFSCWKVSAQDKEQPSSFVCTDHQTRLSQHF